MRIELRLFDLSGVTARLRYYDPELDDIRSVLADLCESIQGRSEFVVSGFGQERWPVDVRTDLTVFLEQLPEAIRRLHADNSAEVDFYEQGIERTLVFTPRADCCLVKCVSRTTWQPDPKTVLMKSETIRQMLEGVRETFLQAVALISPQLLEHPWLRSWAS